MDFIRALMYAICALQFVFCNELKEYESLLLTEVKGDFHLTLPDADEVTKTIFFHTPKNGQTHRFCPNPKDSKPLALHKIVVIPPGTVTNDEKICRSPISVILAKVYNANKVKNKAFKSYEMDLLHAGFILYNKDNRVGNKGWFSWFRKTKPFYGDYISPHRLVVMVEYYYNSTMLQTVAAEYKLPSVQMHFTKSMLTHAKTNFLPGKYLTETPHLSSDADSEKYLKHFEGTVEESWIQKWKEVSQRNPLSLLEFASHEHFALPLWALSARFALNYIPLWKLPKLMWLRVEIYARITAKALGELKVTAGITGTMTLSGKEVVDKDGFKMPKYFWKVFELNKEGKIYGIIIVLNCNPFEKTEKKICETVIDCEENGWVISNKDYSTGEIYCCDMTNLNIDNLKAKFLSLKKNKNVFSLYKWLTKKVWIEGTFKGVIKNEIYHIHA